MPKENKSPQDLIEPMDFAERGILVEPIIYYDRSPSDSDAKELIEPMEYYDIPQQKSEDLEVTEQLQPQVEKTVKVDLSSLFVAPTETTSSDETVSETSAPTVQVEKDGITPPRHVLTALALAAKQAPNSTQASQTDNTLMEIIRHAYPMAQKVLQKIPFMVLRKNLYYYNGTYYEGVTDEEASSLIIQYFRRDMERATSRFMEDILYFIRREPNIQLDEEEITQDLVSFRNGVLDLTSGGIYGHSPKHRTFYRIEADYNPSAASLPAVNFDIFLQQITGGDPILQERLWQVIGYILVSDRRAKALLLFQGVGNSGKSILTDFLCTLFSSNARISMIFQELSGKFSGSELEGKFLCVSNDMPADPLSAKAASLLKQISGNDIVSSDAKYRKRTQFRGTTKLVMVSNHPILLTAADPAFLDRVVTVPFRYAVPREQWDTALLSKILEERTIIVARAVAAYYRLRAQKYIFTGRYEMNAVTASGNMETVPADTPSLIQQFLLNHFEAAENEGVFVEDIYHMFLKTGCFVPLNTFSGCFVGCAGQLFKAQRIRKRRSSQENPQSYVQGIRVKD